jgi:outer membrane biosynthesis protein TonB
MTQRRPVSLVRTGALLALAAMLAACTKGGQFDPTTLLDNDMFDTKKPLQGQREPVFPSGVPGAASGIPADLYKGYVPPPEQAADNGESAGAPGSPNNQPTKLGPQEKPEPKPKPTPKIARAPAKPHTTINVGLAKKPKPAEQQQAQQPQAAQTAWPNPNRTAQPAQSPWPAAPQTAWPSPQQGAPAQQAAQPQTAWPNPTGAAPSAQ